MMTPGASTAIPRTPPRHASCRAAPPTAPGLAHMPVCWRGALQRRARRRDDEGSEGLPTPPAADKPERPEVIDVSP